MIQRIQTIFLLLAAVAQGILAILPFAKSSKAIQASNLFADQVYNIFDNVGILAWFGVALILFLIAIFLFKNRKLQMRLSTFGMISIFAGLGMGILFWFQDQENISEAVITPAVGLVMPALGIVFALLANRAIRKDEKLVRASDRLR